MVDPEHGKERLGLRMARAFHVGEIEADTRPEVGVAPSLDDDFLGKIAGSVFDGVGDHAVSRGDGHRPVAASRPSSGHCAAGRRSPRLAVGIEHPSEVLCSRPVHPAPCRGWRYRQRPSASVRSSCRSSCGRPSCARMALVQAMVPFIVGVEFPDRVPQTAASRDFGNGLS